MKKKLDEETKKMYRGLFMENRFFQYEQEA